MGSFQTIRTIARFEAILLFRSWFFRIFTILILLFLFGMNIGVLSEDNSNWILRALPANIPYFNMVFLNTAMTFIAIFLAIDFLRRDKKLDTSEVIFTRSMTNWDYVWGKTIGVLVVFLVLHILVLLMVMIVNLAIPDVDIHWRSYLVYPLVISLPSVLFVMGFAFLVMSLVRNQAIALVILLGYSGVVMFTLKDGVNFLFDFMAMRLPLMHSDIAGFGYEPALLVQRLIYVALGISMIFATVLLMKRLPQSRVRTLFAWISMSVTAAAGVFLIILHVADFASNKNQRLAMVEANDKYRDYTTVLCHEYRIDAVHEKDILRIKVLVDVTLPADKDLSRTIFSLNPDMELKSVSIGGKELDFKREQHLVLLDLSGAGQSGDTLALAFDYAGRIDEGVAYLDIGKDQQAVKYGPDFIVGIQKRFSFVQENFVLLTPEVLWYPVPGVTHGSGLETLPAFGFARFSGSITPGQGLTPMTQGIKPGEGDTWDFSAGTPLPGLTLVIGPYRKMATEVDSVAYELMVFNDHDYFSGQFSLLGDTLPDLIREMKGDLERTIAMEYPFKSITMVEVPIQFYAYPRLYTNSRDVVQPGIILIPEMAGMLSRGDFAKEIKNQIKRNQERDMVMSDQEIQARVLRNFLTQNFSPAGGGEMRMRFDGPGGGGSSGTNDRPFSIFAMYLNHVNHFEAVDFPVLNTAFEAYMNSQASSSAFFGGMGGVSSGERANMALLKGSLEKIIRSEEDYTLVRDVIQAKGVFLFTYFEALAGTEAFRSFLEQQLLANRYRTTMLRDFKQAFQDQFGYEIGDVTSEWYKITRLSGFLVSGLRVIEMQEGDRTRYQLMFRISNPSEADGLIRITIRAGRGGGMGRGGGGGGGTGFAMAGRSAGTERLYLLKAGEARQIGMILDDQPRGMSINTLVSSNIPNNLTFPFPEVEKIRNFVGFESENSIPVINTLTVPGEYVVDNEDSGFRLLNTGHTSRISNWFKLDKKEEGLQYESIRSWRPPLEWTATTNSMFYGEFIRSAWYTRSGEGEKAVEWSTLLPEPGYYEVFVYVSPMVARMSMRQRGGGGQQGGGPGGGPGGGAEIKDQYHYEVVHDDGADDVAISLANAEQGWNSIGSFYFSADSVKVRLNNRNSGRLVVADAVKWVRQQ